MLRPDAALRPTPATEQVLRPVQAARPAGGGAFGTVFGELRREVIDFIENGAGSRATPVAAMPSGAMPALSLEGQLVRRAARAGTPSSPPADPVVGLVTARQRVDRDAQQDFVAAIAPVAQAAARRLGVAPEIVAAHAALESGWGQRPLRQTDGRTTHNLFGLKAGESWRGEVVQARTTEIEAGKAVSREESFRSYPDAASAFRDYAELLIDNPRYAGALRTGGDARAFAEALMRGGYATDPAYADKLTRVAAQIRWPQ